MAAAELDPPIRCGKGAVSSGTLVYLTRPFDERLNRTRSNKPTDRRWSINTYRLKRFGVVSGTETRPIKKNKNIKNIQ